MIKFLKSIFSKIVEAPPPAPLNTPPEKRITRDMILRANARMIAGEPIERHHRLSAEEINAAAEKAMQEIGGKYREKHNTLS